jgi:hypothetical protein
MSKPWTIDTSGPDHTIWSGEDCIATVWLGSTQHAPVMTAAPDLLAALEQAVDAMQDALEGGEFWQENFAKADIPAIRAAIAKAKGRE